MKEYVFGLAVRVLLTNEEGKILIIKRSTDSKTNPGKWELPGGKVDQGESFDQALLREVQEETNLKVSLDHVVGISQQNLPFIRAVHIIMSGQIEEGELTLSHEHEGYAWVNFETLIEYPLADWLQDYVKTLTGGKTTDSTAEENSENILKPWLNTVRDSMDKVWKKR